MRQRSASSATREPRPKPVHRFGSPGRSRRAGQRRPALWGKAAVVALVSLLCGAAGCLACRTSSQKSNLRSRNRPRRRPPWQLRPRDHFRTPARPPRPPW